MEQHQEEEQQEEQGLVMTVTLNLDDDESAVAVEVVAQQGEAAALVVATLNHFRAKRGPAFIAQCLVAYRASGLSSSPPSPSSLEEGEREEETR